MSILDLKEESKINFRFLLIVWSLIKESKLDDIKNPLPDGFTLDGQIVKKDSEDYYFLQKILTKSKENILKSDFPEEIKEKWLNFYKYENINLKNYLEILKILQEKPFFWNKEYFNEDFSNISEENFLDEIKEIHFKIVDKMHE